MSIIIFDNNHANINKIILEIKSLKSYTFPKFISTIFDLDCVEHQTKFTKTFGEYLMEDICSGTVQNIETDIWWTVCRMIFYENYKINQQTKRVVATNVSRNNCNYEKFEFDSFDNNCRDHNLIVCHYVIRKTVYIKDPSIDESTDENEQNDIINESTNINNELINIEESSDSDGQ